MGQKDNWTEKKANKYTVKQIQQSQGKMYAVVKDGRYYFTHKNEEKIKGIAAKMNQIDEQRLDT